MAALRTVFRNDLFAGRVAIVTGGGTGLGKAITKELAMLGCRVVIASRKMDRLSTAAEEINSALSNPNPSEVATTSQGGAAGHVSSTSPVPEHSVFPFQCNIRSEDQVSK